ncbi:MAG: multicopper oxidase domain-containing protein, partial [Steroidobacteraceae bacterium]
MARTALRVAFGIIWVVNAGFTWTGQFANHYVGYLHNAAQGQPAWSAFWFNIWIAVVTPHAGLFIWLTRIIETLLAIALVLGIARKSLYFAGALFSLLVWSTAEGFGGPYAVGVANMGTGIVYVLVFIALITINSHSGPSPYSLDYYLERCWP